MSLGDIVADGSLLLALPIALLAGLVSFASPCVLPLVPGYLGYVSGFAGGADSAASAGGASAAGGATADGARAATTSGSTVTAPRTASRARLLVGVTLFVLGFTVVFVLFVLTSSLAGFFLVRWSDLIIRIAGLFVIAMGLVFVGQFTFLQRSFKPRWNATTGLAGAPVLGVIFGVGWAPCVGPTLGVVQALALNEPSAGRGILLGVVYSLGLGVPFILVALGLSWVTGSVAWLKRNIRVINIIGGSMLIVVGLLMVSGLWAVFTSSLQGVIGSFVPAI